MNLCKENFTRWVGFNNYYFDYPVMHDMYSRFKLGKTDGAQLALMAHQKANRLIRAGKDDKFQQIIWDNNQIVPQMDLFRIHHFDNMARATSLKILQFNMRSQSIEDLPYAPDKDLTYEEAREVLDYNKHDVETTYDFYLKSLEKIRFREEISKKYDRNFINHNDTKIGKDYFIMELENRGVSCYTYDDGRKPRQTKRSHIDIRNIIFPYIEFERPEFNAVLSWLKRQRITQTKGVFTEIDDLRDLEQYANLKKTKGKVKNLNCIIDGFQFDFGTGGIHGSVHSTIVEEDEYHAVIDYDVTSLYPRIGIVNEIYPEHLGRVFCGVYNQLFEDRMKHAKGTPENAMLKLALNGVYGDSNNVYSPFYDPQYTMTITINGQLMLCMLAEKMMTVEGLELIQINTDGVTVRVPRDKVDEVEKINKEWSDLTKLDLERADYKRMFIRDVNNYIGEYTDGKLKRKGAYEWDALYRPDHPKMSDVQWHKNHSAIVVQRAVEEHLVNGVDIEEFIRNHDDPMDFMLRFKGTGKTRLLWGLEEVQKVSRYYISKNGKPLTKVMPPLKGKTDDRYFKQHKRGPRDKDGQWNVTIMNVKTDVEHIDYAWYVAEAKKLVNPLYEGVLNELSQ
jgi:hypothetical protein